MEKNKDLIELTVDSATAEQRKNILALLNYINTLFNLVSLFTLTPTIGHSTTLILDNSRSARFDSNAVFQQELYEQCLFISPNYLLDTGVVFTILLTSLYISTRFNIKYLLEKNHTKINNIINMNGWLDKLIGLFSKGASANKNEVEMDDESFFKLLNTDYQSKNLSKEKARNIINQLENVCRITGAVLKTAGIIVIGFIMFVNALNIGNKRRLYTLIFDIIAALIFLLVSLKRLIFSSPQTIHAAALKTLSHINFVVFNGKNVLMDNPERTIMDTIILGGKQPVIYTFENNQNIPFFTLHWADELNKLGIKVISADQERIIFLQTQKLTISQINKNEIIERLNQKKKQYNSCISNFEQLKKSLGRYNRNHTKMLNFDINDVKMNWYYVSEKGPDAFIVIPFVLDSKKLSPEKFNEFKSQLEGMAQSNLVCNWQENHVFIKSISSYRKDILLEQLNNLTVTEAHSPAVKDANNLTFSDEDSIPYITTANIHKRFPVKTYKIKVNKTYGLPVDRWNFTDSKIVSSTQPLHFTEIVYASFEVEGDSFYAKAKNLNLLDVNGIQTNTLVFFNQSAKEIQSFKSKNNSEYSALKSLARKAQTSDYGIKKVPKTTDQSMFFRPQDCSKNEVFKVKGHTGIRIFGAKKTAEAGKIEINYSTGERILVDAIIDVKHVLYKHQ